MATSLQCIVYVLRNSDDPPRFYTGVTADLGARLEAHNAGRCSHTSKHRPWAVDVFVTFADETRALKFEKYLKSGSGVEFARRHFR
jgi:predicted GIY-YIG superfamily endonuclease